MVVLFCLTGISGRFIPLIIKNTALRHAITDIAKINPLFFTLSPPKNAAIMATIQ
jgi:hypothetical protein